MRTSQPVSNHEDLVGVVDGPLEELGLDRMTPFGEFTRLGSQVEMSRTPESCT